MSAIIIGIPGAHEQPVVYGYNQQRGYFTRRIWKCTDKESARALIPQLLAAKYSYEITEGAIPMVTAEVSTIEGAGGNTPEVPIDTWEKTVVVVQKDILETAQAKSELNANDFEVLAEAKANGGKITDAQNASLSANGSQYYEAILAGVTSQTVYQTILRHIQTVSTGYPLQWTTTNDGRILTNAQLVSFEGLPSDLKFTLPTSSFSASFLIGWLKVPATIQQSGNTNWVVTQEYQYGEWTPLLYGAAT
jgi:hypothetical protein